MSNFLARSQYERVPEEPKDVELILKKYQQRLDEDSLETTPFAKTKAPEPSSESSPLSKRSVTVFSAVALSVFLLSVLAMYSLSSGPGPTALLSTTSAGASDSMFDAKNRYVMRNFDLARPMSNFLNGLGGIWGIPMWAFYVNRGQGITSFGKQNKDNAIAKFVTAEKAYLQTPFTGFRTFVKAKRGGESFEYMPFFPRMAGSEAESEHLQRNMIIGLNEMEIEEINLDKQLQTNVLYFIAPEQTFPSLVRSATFTNLDPKEELELEVLDGLGQIIPNGLGNYNIDAMGRTMEAWMNVYNVGLAGRSGNQITEPFFHISQDTADTAQVKIIKDGYFALAFVDGEEGELEANGKRRLLPFVVDPSVVFGTDTTLTNPSQFFKSSADVETLVSSPQGTTSRTPCSFAGAKLRIPAGGSVTVTSVYGYAESLETLVGNHAELIRKPKYSSEKREAANAVARDITSRVETKTSSSLFDAYVKQDFLDNVLRGGLPIQLGEKEKKNFHVFSRIHGDIERDYNYFQIDTTYFSQGPGNFRDVCQNRRVDVFLSPEVGDFNLRMFLSFVQSDGYNPLTVASTVFKLDYEKIDEVVSEFKISDSNHLSVVKDVLRRTFRPGQFFRDVEALGVSFGIPKEEVVAKLIDSSRSDFAGQFSQNGYWSDHWTYILDLLDNFLSIFPDQEQQVLWDSEPVPFFVSPALVKPRAERYTLVPNPGNPSQSVVRSYKPISTWGESDFGEERVQAMNAIFTDPYYLVDQTGAAGVWQRSKDGSVFKVSAISKFLLLGTIKFATLDPLGMGVEMEGGKPGWNDAMNGLPGLQGSGMPETFEMLRILRMLKASLQKYKRAVVVPSEFSVFLSEVKNVLDVYSGSAKDEAADFAYWDAMNTAREKYRATVVGFFQGTTETLAADKLLVILQKMEDKVQQGVNRALSTSSTGLAPTYFYYDMVDYSVSPAPNKAASVVTPKKFALRTLPLFLEGPTRYLRVLRDVGQRRRQYELVKQSPLYDQALKMFTLSESLAFMGQDIGRMKAFSAGWLENQSVWLHMSYKFYLELLRGGLYEEFFAEILTGLVPFMDNKVYGRSPLEAASFIVSSAFPDQKLHGASFLARLSGSTVEFLSMWAHMMAGPDPFKVNEEGALELELRPVLPGWLFNEDNEVSFTFLGKVQVTYHNPSKTDTWKTGVKSAKVTLVSGEEIVDDDGVLSSRLATKVRKGEVKKIDVYF